MKRYLCKICNTVNDAEEWNRKTSDKIGDKITNIEDYPEFMYCPACGKKIYEDEFEKVE